MKYIEINENLKVSNIALGCMRISRLSVEELEELILKAVDLGINLFDHADIYGAGKSEELFGEVLLRNPGLRE
ncbi:MAG TPA: aldo/keto reductase family oxidoreductase, partial [Acholeplasmataceae bacterium]|nr:aldo/keto reductase family oxidoreductase [Acholeplasmataceae bacterium]